MGVQIVNMPIKIVTDSSITIEPGIARELDITIVPLSVTIDGTMYSDDDLKFEDFMVKMAASKNLPKTSQPPVGVFAEVYEKIAAEDDEIISIHLTEALSGTVEAARLAKAGASKEEILEKIKYIRENTELFIGFSTLENLVKGGRVSRMTGLFGSLLQVRVIGTLKDRELNTLLRGRGSKTFYKWLEELSDSISSSGRKIREIGISHAQGLEFSQKAKEVLQKFVEKPISILDTNTTIATHTGPGAWAIMIDYE